MLYNHLLLTMMVLLLFIIIVESPSLFCFMLFCFAFFRHVRTFESLGFFFIFHCLAMSSLCLSASRSEVAGAAFDQIRVRRAYARLQQNQKVVVMMLQVHLPGGCERKKEGYEKGLTTRKTWETTEIAPEVYYDEKTGEQFTAELPPKSEFATDWEDERFPDWCEFLELNTKRPYYYNRRTGECMWAHPKSPIQTCFAKK